MPSTVADIQFSTPAFRRSQRASWVSATEGLLTRGASAAEDHYLRTQINTLTLIHPRPTTEYASRASIWSKWVTNAPYYAYPSAYGGSFPYIWSLVGAPAGMEIEAVLDTTSFTTRAAHGRITWPSPTAGTHTFLVRCTDQEGRVVTRDVSLNVADSNAIWVDGTLGTDSTGAAGTKAAPFAKIANWYGGAGGTGVSGDIANATYSGKLVIFRAGTYVVPEDFTGNVLAITSNKPCTWVAYYGETVELDCSDSALRWTSGKPELLGFTMAGENETGLANTYQVYTAGVMAVFCDHTIKNFKNGGTSGADNPGGIATSDSGYTDYVQIRNVRVTGLSGGTNMTANAGAMVLFGYRHYEINNVQCLSQDGAIFSGIHQKHDHQYGVTRLCEILAGNYPNQLYGCVGGCEETHDGHNEWEYNLLATTSATRSPIVVGSGTASSVQGPNQAIRRNTIMTGTAFLASVATADNIDLSANVIQNAAAGWTIDASWSGQTTAEIADLAATSGLVDASGLLTGANRTSYLGRKGWEIA